MAISFVGAGTVQTGANSTVDVPAGVAAGDALLIVTSGTATPTTPTNWTSIFSNGSGRYLNVFLKIATASESSVTLTQSGTSSKAVMLAYRGTSYFDVVGTLATGTSILPATNSLTTRFSNDYVVSFYAVSTNTTPSTWTAPASTTSRVNSGNSTTVTGMLIVDEAQAAAGASTSRVATISSSTAWSSVAISFKEPQAFYIDPESGNDANAGTSFATALKNISGATSAKGITAGDTVRVKEAPIYNTGVNATWTSVQQRGISPFNTQAITGATNAAPIVCTTSLAHGYSTGDVVQITGASGNTATNGVWKITVTSSTQFSLDDSSGNGAWTSGGLITPIFCRTIKTASALVKPIASFAPLKTVSLGTRVAWVGATANVTPTLSTAINKGSVFDQIAINASFTTGKIAYYTLPATLNLSAYQQLSLFNFQSSGTLGGLTISLCSDTTGDTAVDTFTIPSIGATAIWCPFTINKGSALGSSIQSISISRAANNGAQTFIFNSIVAVKSPTSVDALSNTSLVTKNNGTEGAYSVGGFGGSDGTIVFLDSNPTSSNNTTTGGAYYGTTETAGLWRYEPLNPYTLNSAALPSTATTTTTYTEIFTGAGNAGILNAPITFSGGWDSTNMSTRTGQTWFTNQNGNAYGIYNTVSANYYITIDRINYTRCYNGFIINSSPLGWIIQNCNYTATSNIGMIFFSDSRQQLQSCIVTNTQTGVNIPLGSTDINNPIVINNCTISGSVTNNLLINSSQSGFPYYNITNSSFNTSSATGINTTYLGYGAITSNSVNYFNTTGLNTTNNILGTINNLTFVPEPNGGNQIIQGFLTSSFSVLPQNIYTTFNNVTVNAPTTTYSQGTTNLSYAINSCPNFKFVNCSFTPTNVVYTSANLLTDQGGAYLYNCSGVPSTVTPFTNNVPPYTLNAAQYSQDEGNTVGNNKIYFSGGLATSQTAVRNTPSGYAWSLAPTSTSTVTSIYPLKLKLASIAANGGSAVTISAYMRRTNTGLTMQLVCPANQPYGPSTDTTASITAAADTWQQVSISFTPTQNGVYDIYVYVYGGTTYTGYVDDLGVTQ
jgi:hypothetical protein